MQKESSNFQFQLLNCRSHSLGTMLHQLSLQIADLYKQETWSMEPEEDGGGRGFITGMVRSEGSVLAGNCLLIDCFKICMQPQLYETHVTTQAKLIRELLLQKYADERQLLKSEEVRAELSAQLGTALGAVSDVSHHFRFRIVISVGIWRVPLILV